MKFIDIHTHKRIRDKVEVFSLNNVLVNENEVLSKDKYYSVGIHPWYVAEYKFDEYIDLFKSYFENKNVIAVGEIGLDKFKENFDLQIKYFEYQLKFAEENQLPVIIHCVKSFEEIIKILSEFNFKNPIIFHRYGGNSQITTRLLNFNSYFSFGDSALNEKSSSQRILKQIPLDRLFLETDDSNINLKEIYSKTAQLKEITLDNLLTAIIENYNKIFKNISNL
jgi:TatD DNase family protein